MNVLMEMSVLIMLDVPILLEVIDVIVTPDSDRKEDFVLVKKKHGPGGFNGQRSVLAFLPQQDW